MRVKFGPWLPDQPDLDSGGLEECAGCIPLESGYTSIRENVTLSGTVTVSGVNSSLLVPAINGAYLFVGRGGTQGIGRLFITAGATTPHVSFTSVNRTATYTASTSAWAFTRFGSTILASNHIDTMQVGSTSTNFRDQSASASAPVAKCLATVRDFVFAGNIVSGGAGAGSNRVQWCQINNALRWTPSARSQSDFQDLPDTGDVLAITGGDFAAIFTERAVWRATYVGSPVIFRFDQVASDVACMVPASAARYQNLTFFLSTTGFQVFDGSQCIPIGSNSVDKFALDYVDSFNHRSPLLRGLIDLNNKLYIATVKKIGGDALLIYNFASSQWAFLDMGTAGTGTYLTQITPSLILAAGKGQDAFFPDIPAMYDPARRLGIGAFIGSTPVYTEFISDAAHRTATFATGEAQPFTDHRAFVRGIRPLIQGDSNTSVSVEIGRRNQLTESVSYTSAVNVNANGLAPVRADARYLRARVKVTGGFQRAVGFDIDAVRSGKR